MRTRTLMLLCLAAAIGSPDAVADRAAPDGFHPDCGAPGDLVYVQGPGLGTDAVVRIDGRVASVVRGRPEALLCRIPSGLEEGHVRISVDGITLRETFLVLAKGRPVIHGTSAGVVRPGGALLLYGRRLRGGTIELIDGLGTVSASAAVVGGGRVVMARLPTELVPGAYRVRLTNVEGPCPEHALPALQVSAPDRRRCFAVGADLVYPGRRIDCVGTELAPLGSCDVRWKRTDGRVWSGPGWSNGYDRITTVVPCELATEQWYHLQIASPGGKAVRVASVFVRATESPRSLELDAASAAPGGVVGLHGMPASGLGCVPELLTTWGETPEPARTLYRHPGGLGHGRSWLVRLPDSLDAGEYRVTVRVKEVEKDAGTLHVGAAVPPSADASR